MVCSAGPDAMDIPDHLDVNQDSMATWPLTLSLVFVWPLGHSDFVRRVSEIQRAKNLSRALHR